MEFAERPFTVSAHERGRIDGCASLSRSRPSLPRSPRRCIECVHPCVLPLAARTRSTRSSPPRRRPASSALVRRARISNLFPREGNNVEMTAEGELDEIAFRWDEKTELLGICERGRQRVSRAVSFFPSSSFFARGFFRLWRVPRCGKG